MVELFANSGDPDQTPHSAASDLGLHCLPITLLRVSRLQWVNDNSTLVVHFVLCPREDRSTGRWAEREKYCTKEKVNGSAEKDKYHDDPFSNLLQVQAGPYPHPSQAFILTLPTIPYPIQFAFFFCPNWSNFLLPNKMLYANRLALIRVYTAGI